MKSINQYIKESFKIGRNKMTDYHKPIKMDKSYNLVRRNDSFCIDANGNGIIGGAAKGFKYALILGNEYTGKLPDDFKPLQLIKNNYYKTFMCSLNFHEDKYPDWTLPEVIFSETYKDLKHIRELLIDEINKIDIINLTTENFPIIELDNMKNYTKVIIYNNI